MRYLDELEEYDPQRFAARRYFFKARHRRYVADSLGKLPNELRDCLADDEDFNTRYSYHEDYL